MSWNGSADDRQALACCSSLTFTLCGMSRSTSVRARSRLPTWDVPGRASHGLRIGSIRLPRVLGADALRRLCDAIVGATGAGRPVVAAVGGHVVKTGCGVYLVDWMSRGILTGLALNGSAAIHDLELAIAGKTSEDVGSRLMAGNVRVRPRDVGSLCPGLRTRGVEVDRTGVWLWGTLSSNRVGPVLDQSLLVAARRLDVPLTVHVAIGTDIVHMTPALDGAALGKAALDDFRGLCGLVARLWQGASGLTSAARS